MRFIYAFALLAALASTATASIEDSNFERRPSPDGDRKLIRGAQRVLVEESDADGFSDPDAGFGDTVEEQLDVPDPDLVADNGKSQYIPAKNYLENYFGEGFCQQRTKDKDVEILQLDCHSLGVGAINAQLVAQGSKPRTAQPILFKKCNANWKKCTTVKFSAKSNVKKEIKKVLPKKK